MKKCWSVVPAVLFICFLISGGCTSTAPSPAVPATPSPGLPGYPQVVSPSSPTATPSPESFTLNVASLVPGTVLPDVYSCEGASESPAVSWGGVPAGAISLVLILDDPDAPGGTFTHWIVYNIPPDARSIPAGQTAQKVLANGAQQGDSSARSRGYYPPCPPVGTKHRYLFWLYAVDGDITQPTADRVSINMALAGHTIAKTEFLTTFTR